MSLHALPVYCGARAAPSHASYGSMTPLPHAATQLEESYWQSLPHFSVPPVKNSGESWVHCVNCPRFEPSQCSQSSILPSPHTEVLHSDVSIWQSLPHFTLPDTYWNDWYSAHVPGTAGPPGGSQYSPGSWIPLPHTAWHPAVWTRQPASHDRDPPPVKP